MANKAARLVAAIGAAAFGLFSVAAGAQNFIYGNSAGNGIYKSDKNTGAVVATCSQTQMGLSLNGRGIVVVGNVVYLTFAGSNNVYKTNFTTCSNDGIAFTITGASSLSTIAFDGTNFWVGDYSGTNQAFYVSPSGTLLNTVTLANCGGSCDGLEFFNGKLISNRGDAPNPGNYDVYSTTGTLLTSAFIGPTAYSATGIAYDGTNFYVSDIFNQNLQVYDGTTGAFLKTVKITGMTLSNVIEDLSADYSITIPTTPPPTTPTSIPTMSEWALIVMAAMLAISAFVFLRRRSR